MRFWANASHKPWNWSSPSELLFCKRLSILRGLCYMEGGCKWPRSSVLDKNSQSVSVLFWMCAGKVTRIENPSPKLPLPPVRRHTLLQADRQGKARERHVICCHVEKFVAFCFLYLFRELPTIFWARERFLPCAPVLFYTFSSPTNCRWNGV